MKDALLQDVRYGLRVLRKAPAFTVIAVLILGLGIGANTAIFSVVNAVLLQPLPFEDSGRLVQVWHVPPPKSFPGIPIFAVSPANYLDWENQNHVFEKMAIYHYDDHSLTGVGEPESVSSIAVSDNFFAVLRARPLLGRTFLPEENQPGRGQVAILSQFLWKNRFGGDPGMVGRTISLDGQHYTVVGVLPAKLTFPTSSDPKSQPQLWTPLAWTDAERAVRGNHNYEVIARLAPNTDLKRAQAEMNAISSRLEQQYPADDKGWGATIVPLREQLVGDVRPALMILLGAVGFVLLIACANVANLILVKTLSRQKEIAIRSALGASSLRVTRQIVSETLLLALAGGGLALLLAHYGVRLIVAFLAQQLPRADGIGLDGQVLIFTLVVSLLTGILAGLIPAVRISRGNLNQRLKQGLGRTDADSGGNRVRSMLAVSEIALSLVLLIGAGLMIRSLSRLRGVDPGMVTHNVLTMVFRLPDSKYPKEFQQVEFTDRLLARVRSLPGVESAGAIDSLPIADGGSTQPVAVEGQPTLPMSEQPEVAVRIITPGFAETLRIPLLRGRTFTSSDVESRPAVIVVSESMAKQFWPHENPIGKRLTMTFFPEKVREVVGVVGDVKQDGLDVANPTSTLYLPFAQRPSPNISLVVRAARPYGLVSAISNAAHEIDREQPVMDVMSMEDIVSHSLSHQRFSVLLLECFSGLALLLATIGIYSVLSYSVRQRVREIGVRMALGAQRSDVLRMVLGQGSKMILIGAAVGLAAALGVTRFMASQLFGVTATDPVTFLCVAALIVFIAMAACYVPARRATRVDPMEALRYE